MTGPLLEGNIKYRKGSQRFPRQQSMEDSRSNNSIYFTTQYILMIYNRSKSEVAAEDLRSLNVGEQGATWLEDKRHLVEFVCFEIGQI